MNRKRIFLLAAALLLALTAKSCVREKEIAAKPEPTKVFEGPLVTCQPVGPSSYFCACYPPEKECV